MSLYLAITATGSFACLVFMYAMLIWNDHTRTADVFLGFNFAVLIYSLAGLVVLAVAS